MSSLPSTPRKRASSGVIMKMIARESFPVKIGKDAIEYGKIFRVVIIYFILKPLGDLSCEENGSICFDQYHDESALSRRGPDADRLARELLEIL